MTVNFVKIVVFCLMEKDIFISDGWTRKKHKKILSLIFDLITLRGGNGYITSLRSLPFLSFCSFCLFDHTSSHNRTTLKWKMLIQGFNFNINPIICYDSSFICMRKWAKEENQEENQKKLRKGKALKNLQVKLT